MSTSEIVSSLISAVERLSSLLDDRVTDTLVSGADWNTGQMNSCGTAIGGHPTQPQAGFISEVVAAG